MKLLDIFSKKPLKSESKPQASKIIIDHREKSSLVPSELSSLNIPFEFAQLKVADYIVNNIAIERKTLSDFQNSIINKRLLSQLKEIKQYPKYLLILEGVFQKDLINIHENAFKGFLLSTILHHQVPIIFTKNPKDTASYLAILAKKSKPSNNPIRPSKIHLTKQQQIQYILEGFPNIGPATIKKLLSHFKSLKNIINSSEKELTTLLGKKGTNLYNLINTNTINN